MIYLASAYSHDDPDVRRDRYKLVHKCAYWLTVSGQIVYSPIVHFHHMTVQFQLPPDFDYWSRINAGMLRQACKLLVLESEGLLTSKGVAAEIKIAEELMIPTAYVTPEGFEIGREV